jgi:hypothetical protein
VDRADDRLFGTEQPHRLHVERRHRRGRFARRWPDLSSVEPSPKFAPAQNDLPCAASTTARHWPSRSNASSASPIWLISAMSKKLCGGLRISIVPT